MRRENQALEPMDFSDLKTTSLYDRPSKVTVTDFAKPARGGHTFGGFLEGLPNILAGAQFKEAVQKIAAAVRDNRSVILGMGAHPIKVGLSPVLIDALERGIITGVAVNGAVVIHDVEIALAGKTSEEVADYLHQGAFGTARETAEFIHSALKKAYRQGNKGFGRAVGEELLAGAFPHTNLSVVATAARLNIPLTVHVAVGTDIVHMHPAMDGAAVGALSHYDFRLFCRMVSRLERGVFINLGSAVIIPEVFLKAVSVAANQGFSLKRLSTINMDFQRHYRPQTNVVERPTREVGKGFQFIGHHEIMLPLLMAAVIEELDRRL